MKNQTTLLQARSQRDLRVVRYIISLLILVGFSTISYATTITVMNTNDNGNESLREAVEILALSGDTIVFDVITNGNTINLTSGQIDITSTITIIGNGRTNTIIDGTGNSRIFQNTATGVSIIGLTIQNGMSTADGGGINNIGIGELTIDDCDIINNIVTGSAKDGGGIYSTGAKVTVANSTISENTATGEGGGLYINSGAGDLSKVFVTGNESTGRGGGIGNASASDSINITGSVISGNKAISFGGGISTRSKISIRNSTIAGNTSNTQGGGIITQGGMLVLYHTIVAKNVGTFATDIRIFSGSVIDLGFNHVMDGFGIPASIPGDGIDPMFVSVPIAPSIGGDLRLMCVSVAIDRGASDTTGLNIDVLDIAGLPRFISGRIDIGAYERELAANCHEIDISDDGVSLVDSTLINYGEICLSAIDTFILKNSASHYLILDSIILDVIGVDPAQFVYNTGDFIFPDTLAIGDSSMLIVTFAPVSMGFDSTIVQIYSNDLDEAIYDIVLRGASDIAPPQLTCRDTTVYLDVLGQVTIDSSYIIDELSDICGTVTVDIDQEDFDCTESGANSVTLTITEAPSGLQSMCTSTVTVLDTISPILTCMDTSLFLGLAGAIIIDTSYVISALSDNCGIASATLSKTSFDCNDVGSNMVTLTVIDIHGNVTICTVEVEISTLPLTEVHNTNDSGCGSLRSAIANAISGDTIRFDPIIDGGTITLTSGLIILDKNLVIMGNDTTQTIIDGSGNSRIFEITSGAIVSIESLTIQNGGSVTEGGGIKNGGTLSLSDSKIHMNMLSATSAVRGGGIYNSGIATIQGCDISDNTLEYTGTSSFSTNGGGGIYNVGNASSLTISDTKLTNNVVESTRGLLGGALFIESGNCTITSTLIALNSALSTNFPVRGGGVSIRGSGNIVITQSNIINNTTISSAGSTRGAGIESASANVTIRNSRISSNEAKGFDFAEGGGYYLGNGDLDIYNTIISGNKAHTTELNQFSNPSANGGGIYNVGGTIKLTNNTIAGNEVSNAGTMASSNGGGIRSFGTIQIKNTIVAHNIANTSGADISNLSTIQNLGNNLVLNPSGNHGITSGNNIDPLFLINVGVAPTITGDLRLECGSTAIDGGSSDTLGLNLGTVDIDGLSRLVGKHIDIGAHERGLDANCHEIDVIRDELSIADSTRIDYVEVCEPVLDTFFIKNTEQHFVILDTIIIDGIGVDPAQFTYNIGAFSFPDTIAYKDSSMLIVTFAPVSMGYDSAIIKIFSNDIDEAIYDIVLSGARDIIPPTLTCRDTTVYLNAIGQVGIDSSFIIDGLHDVCGSVTADIDVENFNCTDIGTNPVNLTLTESLGLQATCSAVVTVMDTISLALQCKDTTVFVDVSGTAIIDTSYVISSMSDNCNIASAVLSQSSFDCTEIGANMVTLSVTDNHGTLTNCTAIVTVLDSINPLIICKDTTIYLDANGSFIIDSSYVVSSISDNCGIASVSLSQTSFDCMMIGSNQITITGTDSYGGQSNCSVVVTAMDTISPVITCMDTVVFLDAAGSVMIDSSFIISNISDNCEIAAAVPDITNFDCSNKGVNMVMLTVADISGRQSMCTSEVNVLDTIDPIINCTDTTVILDALGTTTIDSTFVLESFSDNCNVLSVQLSQSSFDCTEVGTHMIEIIVSDGVNHSTCSAQVTIASLTSNSVVQNTKDSGCGSLRFVILSAIAGDTITFSPSITGDTIELTSGQLLLDKDIVIVGNESIKTVIDGGDNDRIFKVTAGDTISLHHLTIQRGGGVINGGGIFNEGHLTLSDCDIINNQAISGGGIFSKQEIIIFNSLISQNSSSNSGGGFRLDAGSSSIKNTIISGNYTISTVQASGGGISIGASATATIINSIISGNVISGATAFGGGLIMSNSSILTLRNSTISGNIGIGSNFSQGGGLYFQNSTIDLTNCLIAKNRADSGPDIFKTASGIIIDGGGNHVMNPNAHNITSGNNIDPLFVMDVDTTGGMPTTSGDLKLACGSPAIDAGTPDTIGLNLGVEDIGGLSRVQGTIDIGAHERGISCPEYSDCSQVNVDLDAALLTITDPLALFSAQLELKSDATLTRDITTKAGQAIIFDESFTVNQGTVLEAIIEVCP